MRSPAADDLLKASVKFNEAVLNEHLWHDALQHLANVFNGSFATFEVIDRKSGKHLQHYDSSDIEIQKDYLDYYMPINPRIAFGRKPGSPDIIHDRLFMSEQDMDRNEFYNDFLRPNDLRYCLLIRAHETNETQSVFTIQKTWNAGPATDEKILALKELGNQLATVAQFQIQHHQLAKRYDLLDQAFDALEDGMIVLNDMGSAIAVNQAAQEILCRADGIGFNNGKPHCVDSASNEKLEQAVYLATSKTGVENTRHLLVQRPSGLPPYLLTIQSIARSDNRFGGARAEALLIIKDHTKTHAIDIDVLRDCFGLTRAEANVAIALASGKTARDIMEATTISLPTVRTHIQRVLQKLSVSRQSEVVRLLSRYI